MKIKKIFIIRYGPLQNMDLDIGPGLQVIWGRNEAGKTLTIDAIIKMMLEGKVRDFDRINRVEEDPEGFILFEDTGGEEKKISVKKGLARYVPFAGLDLRNIFIIRDSDLTLKQECGYYKSITDKLTGMNLEKIEGLLSGIKDYGRLTRPSSDADLSDNREYGKAASLVREVRSFISDSTEYMDHAGDQKYDFLELDQLKARQDIIDIRKKIDIAEEAQNWDRYNKMSQSLDHLIRSWNEYQELKEFNQANYVVITGLELEIGSIDEKIDGLKKDFEKNSTRKTSIDEKIMEVQASAGPMENKKKEIDRLKNELEIFNRRKSEETRETGIFQKILAAIFLVLVPASFPLVYFPTKNILVSFVLPALFFVGAVIVIASIGRAGIGENRFKADGSMLENGFRKLGLKIRSLEDIFGASGAFEEEYFKICQTRESLQDQLKLLDIKLSETSANIRNDENRKKALIIEKEKFFSTLSIYSVDEYRENLRKRNRAESNMLSGIRNMSGLSGTVSPNVIMQEETDTEFEKLAPDMEGLIKKWMAETGRSKPSDDPGNGKVLKFDPVEYGDLKNNLLELQEREGMLDHRLDEHTNSLNEFQRRFLHLNIGPYLKNYNAVNINTLEKLKEACGIAESFLEIINGEYNIAIGALKIFEDIKSQEETKISDLFERLGVSGVFGEITGGKYTGVQFDSKLQTVKVIDEYERELEASKLSKGAYDQLFMAIRIAIAEEMLGEGKGFFIMDDAFLASDRYRIKKQFEILKKLADRGWSILYFSVKDEVRELAVKFSKNKVLEI